VNEDYRLAIGLLLSSGASIISQSPEDASATVLYYTVSSFALLDLVKSSVSAASQPMDRVHEW